MKKENADSRNVMLFAAKESMYSSVAPVLWGSVTQMFLLHRGVSTPMVGYYATLISAVQMLATMLLSNMAERVRDPLRFCTRLLLMQSVVSVLYLPIALVDMGSMLTLLIISVMTVLQLGLLSCKCICDYKVNYQIIYPEHYGTMVFLGNAIMGLAGVAFSALYSAVIDRNTAGNPYFICMALTFGMLLLATLFNALLKPVNTFTPRRTPAPNPWRQLKELLQNRNFRVFIIPNLMRGVTLSITGCIVLVAVVMGIDERGQAKIPLICAMATAGASVLYMLLSKKLQVEVINIIGGVLTCALIFLPRGNTELFLGLYFVAHLGRVLVDNAIPTMLYPIVEPQLAGAYNAWRSVLYGVSSIIVMPIVSSLLEHVHPLVFLIPGAVLYLIVTVWYCIEYRRITGK